MSRGILKKLSLILSIFVTLTLVVNVAFAAGTEKTLTLEEDWRLIEPLDIDAGEGNVVVIDGQDKYTIYEMTTSANLTNSTGIVRFQGVRLIHAGTSPAEGSLAELLKAAKGITSVTNPLQDATTLTMPVAAGFDVSILSSSNEDVIALDGTITPPDTEQVVNLVFTLAGNGGEADTVTIPVTVPARTPDVNEYVLTVTAGTGGTATGSGNYEENEVVTITATANTNYAFSGWSIVSGSGTIASSSNASTTYTMPAGAATVQASFTYTGGNNDDDDEDEDDDTNTPPSNPPATGNNPSPTPVPQSNDEPSPKAEEGKITLDTTVENDTASAIVDDQLVNTAFEQAVADDRGTKTITVEVKETTGAKSYSAQFAAAVFKEGSKDKKIEIKTPSGTAVLSANMIESIAPEAQNVSLAIGAANTDDLSSDVKSKIGDRPVIEINLSIDGNKTAWSNSNAPVSISIPYTPKAGENYDNIVIWYIDGESKANIVSTGRYNPDTGMVSFKADHFSTYAVSYNEKTFEDLNISWGKKEIEFLAARGIIRGTSGTKYSPKQMITRADFAKYLMGVINKKADITGNFTDISETDYFYNEVMTANALGIINGVGGGMFAPDRNIIRQDVMVMLDRALKAAGMELTEKEEISQYTDASLVSDYAKDSVEKLIASGIIQGWDSRISPTFNMTREEAARVLYLVYMKMY